MVSSDDEMYHILCVNHVGLADTVVPLAQTGLTAQHCFERILMPSSEESNPPRRLRPLQFQPHDYVLLINFTAWEASHYRKTVDNLCDVDALRCRGGGAPDQNFLPLGATTLAQPQQPLMDLTSRQESTNVTMEIKARLLRRTDQKMVLLAHQVKSYLVDADDPADVIACVWSIPETLSPYLTSYGHGLVSQCFSDNVTMQMDVDPSFRYSDSSTDQGGGIILELAGLSLRAAFRARNDDEGDSAWTAPGCFPRHFQLGKEAVFAHFLEALEEFQCTELSVWQ